MWKHVWIYIGSLFASFLFWILATINFIYKLALDVNDCGFTLVKLFILSEVALHGRLINSELLPEESNRRYVN